jgi:predicted ArsR family transcriptional regulator
MTGLDTIKFLRPAAEEVGSEERRVREYLEGPGGVSESVQSLSEKLGIGRRQCRRVLEGMVEQGLLKRQEFVDIEPIYTRFPTRGPHAAS